MKESEKKLPIVHCPECHTPLEDELVERLVNGLYVYCETCGYQFRGLSALPPHAIKSTHFPSPQNNIMTPSKKKDKKEQYKRWKEEWKKIKKEYSYKIKTYAKSIKEAYKKKKKNDVTYYSVQKSSSQTIASYDTPQNHTQAPLHQLTSERPPPKGKQPSYNNSFSSSSSFSPHYLSKIRHAYKLLHSFFVVSVILYVTYFLSTLSFTFMAESGPSIRYSLPQSYVDYFYTLFITVFTVVVDSKYFIKTNPSDINTNFHDSFKSLSLVGIPQIIMGFIIAQRFFIGSFLIIRGVIRLFIFISTLKSHSPQHILLRKGRSTVVVWTLSIVKSSIFILIPLAIASSVYNTISHLLTFTSYAFKPSLVWFVIISVILYFITLSAALSYLNSLKKIHTLDELKVFSKSSRSSFMLFGLLISLFIYEDIILWLLLFVSLLIFKPLYSENAKIDKKEKETFFSDEEFNQIVLNINRFIVERVANDELFSSSETSSVETALTTSPQSLTIPPQRKYDPVSGKLRDHPLPFQSPLQVDSPPVFPSLQKDVTPTELPPFPSEHNLDEKPKEPLSPQTTEVPPSQEDFQNKNHAALFFTVLSPEIHARLISLPYSDEEKQKIAETLIYLDEALQRKYLEEIETTYHSENLFQVYKKRLLSLPLSPDQKKVLVEQLLFIPEEHYEEFLNFIENSLGMKKDNENR